MHVLLHVLVVGGDTCVAVCGGRGEGTVACESPYLHVSEGWGVRDGGG